MDTYNVTNDRFDTNGYNQPTSTPISNDVGMSFCCGVGDAANLAQGRTLINDPFPVRANGTRFDEPLQNVLGGMIRTGQGFDMRPWDYRPDLQHRWRVGFQREIARNLMVDVSYNGAYSYLTRNFRVNYLPEQYWTKGMVRDQANDNALNAQVVNPFRIQNFASLQQSNPVLYNWMAGQSFYTGQNIRVNQLLRQYPQFSGTLQGIRPEDDWKNKQGYVTYHDLQLLVERRFTAGFTGSFMYTYAKSQVADWQANQFDNFLTERPNNNVLPHRIAATAVYELPFGKGRTYLKDGFLSHLIGNWNTSGVFQVQSGPATGDWGNRFFYGDVSKIADAFKHEEVNSKDIHQWFDPSIAWRGTTAPPSGFVGFDGRSAAQPGEYHVRMFPIRLDALRADGIFNVDLKMERTFPIKPERGMMARFSVDLLNATNRTNFSGPNLDPTNANFGRVTSQRGLSRVIQFNLRFEF